ncbi:cation diffusion facilitator family transporter [Desulfovibrio mangrovi]|uniref:cation diffusion facilitator family transporter n=1 Tax=Desulfovibrio mangrovi TaxID=2976983 RepID=UPI002245B8DF|nr:cation diffusion facilitator family transporter [Desulfovibrio mangrovi]UZP67945.1 cation diffusion facilitator family transporter [Desulfovibrio mangrovi]
MASAEKTKAHISAVCRVTWVGLFVNVVLSAIKVTAGIAGNSRAVLADGIHSISDMVTDVALLVGVHFWSAPADENHPYGHGRLETLVTVCIGLLLAAAGIGIGWDAISGFRTGEIHHSKPVAFWASFVSIVANELLYQWTVREGRRLNSSAVIANAWHHRSDALSSIPAALAVGVAMLLPEWAFVDLVGAIVVAVFILHAAWSICYPALEMLIDRTAPTEVMDRLNELACSVPGVLSVHRLRSRYQGAGLLVDMHIGVDGGISVKEGHDIADAVERLLLTEELDVAEVLVHVDPWLPEDESCT